MNYMETVSLKKYLNQISTLLPYFSLFFYLWWGTIILKEDFEIGKIRNSLLLLGVKFVLTIIILHVFLTEMGKLGYVDSYLTYLFYLHYIYHLVQSIIFSFILWYGEIWPAGDSKFYTVNMMFLPLINPMLVGFPDFLWISVMINTFIIAAVCSTLYYLKENIILLQKGDNDAFKEIKEYYFNEFRNFLKLEPNTLFIVFSVFSTFSYKQFLNLILQNYVFNVFSRTDIFFFVLYFLWPKISKFFNSKYWKYLMLFIYSLIFYYISKTNDPISSIGSMFIIAMKNTFSFGIIFVMGNLFIGRIIESYNTYHAGKDEIKRGMILSSQEIKILRENEIFNGLFNDFFKDGLTQEQVEALKKWMENHPVKDVKLKFVKAKPFALNIFVGCLIQIIFNNNILKWLI